MAASGTLGNVKSSIGIVLFFLLSAFFLSVLLGALEHSRRLLGIAAGCLVAVVCVIVFLTPVQLPSLDAVFGIFDDEPSPATTTEVPGAYR
jgi:predicted branched-subunit amino acid permease